MCGVGPGGVYSQELALLHTDLASRLHTLQAAALGKVLITGAPHLLYPLLLLFLLLVLLSLPPPPPSQRW